VMRCDVRVCSMCVGFVCLVRVDDERK